MIIIQSTMRYGPEHKARTREAILDAAGALFREEGYRGASIEAIMARAGLTIGGFYAHFSSKEDLFAAVIEHTAQATVSQREEGLDGLQGADWVAGLVRRYLSPGHLDHVAEGCTMPPLLSELARSGTLPRDAFATAFDDFRNRVAAHLATDPEAAARATAIIAAAVGAMSIARAMPDRARAEAILRDARRQALFHLLGIDAESAVPASPPSGVPDDE